VWPALGGLLVLVLAPTPATAERPAAERLRGLDGVARAAEAVLAAKEKESEAAEQPGGGGGGETAGAATGAKSGAATDTTTGEHDAGEVVITGKKPPVEQGERSHFTDLPPRDLFLRPRTESVGLETATSVVGREEIDWLEAYSVVDALQFVPGAWVETRGRKVKQFFSVRGQRYPYPGYVLDGAWIREFQEMDYFLSSQAVERIEVIRSSAVLLHGPGGMTGMVNIVPRTYTGPETTFTQIYGSDNLTRTELTHGDGDETLSYGLAVGFRHTDGPKEENAEENITNLYANVQYRPTKDLTLSMTHYSFLGKRELQRAEPPSAPTVDQSFDPMRTYGFVGRAHYHPSDRASTEIVGNYAIRRFFAHQEGAADWLEEDYEYGAGVIQTIKHCDPNTLRFGGTFNRWRTPTGARYYVGNPGDLVTWTGFVVDEHQFDRLRVDAGYRFALNEIKRFGGFNVEGAQPGPLRTVVVEDEWDDPLHTFTLGGAYDLTSEYALLANFAVGQISSAPGMLDVNLQRPTTETRWKYDVGLRRTWDGFGEASLTAFYVIQHDAAVVTRNRVLGPDGNWFALYQNAERDNYGLELDVRSKRFDCGTQFFLNGVYVQVRDDLQGHWEEDQEVPEFILGAGVSQLVGDAWEVSVFTKHVSPYENERFLPAGTPPAPLGHYTEVNFKLAYFFGDKKQHRAFFLVENLGGQHYSTVVGYPHEGVRYSGGVTLRW